MTDLTELHDHLVFCWLLWFAREIKQKTNRSKPTGPQRLTHWFKSLGTAAVHHSLTDGSKREDHFASFNVGNQWNFNLQTVTFVCMYCSGNGDIAVTVGVHVRTCLPWRQRLFHIETLWDRVHSTGNLSPSVRRQSLRSQLSDYRQTVCPSCFALCPVQGHSCHS